MANPSGPPHQQYRGWAGIQRCRRACPRRTAITTFLIARPVSKRGERHELRQAHRSRRSISSGPGSRTGRRDHAGRRIRRRVGLVHNIGRVEVFNQVAGRFPRGASIKGVLGGEQRGVRQRRRPGGAGSQIAIGLGGQDQGEQRSPRRNIADRSKTPAMRSPTGSKTPAMRSPTGSKTPAMRSPTGSKTPPMRMRRRSTSEGTRTSRRQQTTISRRQIRRRSRATTQSRTRRTTTRPISGSRASQRANIPSLLRTPPTTSTRWASRLAGARPHPVRSNRNGSLVS